MLKGETYLPLYSKIYGQSNLRKTDLTTTVVIRNLNRSSKIYLSELNYYNRNGEIVNAFITRPVELKPMETIELVVFDDDQEGVGGTVHFEWAHPNWAVPPIFEGVMISTSGQQGISFSTSGIMLD